MLVRQVADVAEEDSAGDRLFAEIGDLGQESLKVPFWICGDAINESS